MSKVQEFADLVKGRAKPEGSKSPDGKRIKRGGKWVPVKQGAGSGKDVLSVHGRLAFNWAKREFQSKSYLKRIKLTAKVGGTIVLGIGRHKQGFETEGKKYSELKTEILQNAVLLMQNKEVEEAWRRVNA